jgi:hypothetical protein
MWKGKKRKLGLEHIGSDKTYPRICKTAQKLTFILQCFVNCGSQPKYKQTQNRTRNSPIDSVLFETTITIKALWVQKSKQIYKNNFCTNNVCSIQGVGEGGGGRALSFLYIFSIY